MAEDGVCALVATPHVELALETRGGLAGRLAELDLGWENLQRCAEEAGVAVRRGAELRLDTADPDLNDPRLRLAGGPFVLVEFPFFMVPPRSHRVLSLIRSRGWTPLVGHPERYSGIDAELDVVAEWRAAGARLQVNGGSLLGRYGEAPRAVALALLARGWADYLGSDYHARGRPRVRDYHALLVEAGGATQAELLLSTNPRRLLRGEQPLPVPALVLGSEKPARG